MALREFALTPGLAHRAAGIQNRSQKVASLKRRIVALHQYDPPLTAEQAAELVAALVAPFDKSAA